MKKEERFNIAKVLINLLDDKIIADKTGLTIDEVRSLR